MPPFTFFLRVLSCVCLLTVSDLTVADNPISTFNDQTGLLILPDVQVANQHYYVEMQYQNSIFTVKNDSIKPSTSLLTNPAQFDADILTIPKVAYLQLQHYYSAELTHLGNFKFKVRSTTQTLSQCDPSKGPIYAKGTQVKGDTIGSTGPGGGVIFAPGLEAQRKDANVGGETYYSQYKYNDGSVQHFYSWDEAQKVAQSYGAGWHLPTMDELILLCQQQSVVGNFGFDKKYLGIYWSSTQFNDYFTWGLLFDYGSTSAYDRSGHYLVRAVRTF